MEKLTEKELELMKLFWATGDAFVRELVDRYPSPKPHFNTVSTYVRLLEKKGPHSPPHRGGGLHDHPPR